MGASSVVSGSGGGALADVVSHRFVRKLLQQLDPHGDEKDVDFSDADLLGYSVQLEANFFEDDNDYFGTRVIGAIDDLRVCASPPPPLWYLH